MDQQVLLTKLDRLHTTALGKERIRKNLKIETDDTAGFCRRKIMDPHCQIRRQGKNWYCLTGRIQITINAQSLTIITAHLISIFSGR